MDLDNHPIPQDVSHFQFKLIGEMTLKQFGYLAGGVGMGWLIFILPINILVKLPIALLYAGAGVILAFVPIEGRPADTMIKNFIRVLFIPNQYVYRKESADPILTSLLQDVTQPKPIATVPQPTVAPTQSMPPVQPGTPRPLVHIESPAVMPSQPRQATQPTMVHTEATPYYQQAQQQPANAPQQPSSTLPVAPVPSPQSTEEQQKESQLHTVEQTITQQTTTLNEALAAAKATEVSQQQGTPEYEQAHQKALELEEQLNRAAAQKQQLEQELLAVKQQLAQQQAAQPIYTPSVATPPQQTEHVRKIPASMSTSIGMPSIPDVPNLITGIVKDSRGNVLPSVLIEVKDTEGNPVRAFKTNQLGQFASATPLLNGTYTIYFEDPTGKHTFDTIQLTANGEVMMPIEIISIDQREELRKELFG